MILELVVAGLFAVGGIRSFAVWFGRPFESPAVRDQVLYALHRTGRVGLWFAFSGLFLGFALVDQPQDLRWFFFVPVGLAGIQMLSGVLLGQSRGDEGHGPR